MGSARRECFDHVIAFNEAGVRKLMTRYGSYYEEARTHLALDKDAPIPRPVIPPGEGDIVAIPEVGGLHHRYGRRAAAARWFDAPERRALTARPGQRPRQTQHPSAHQ